MACGEVKFVQKGRDDQAEMGDLSFPKKVAELFGVDYNELFKGFCKPKIKVGTEWVTKRQTFALSWILLVLKCLTTMGLNRFQSTLLTKSCNSFSTITCLLLNKNCIKLKALMLLCKILARI